MSTIPLAVSMHSNTAKQIDELKEDVVETRFIPPPPPNGAKIQPPPSNAVKTFKPGGKCPPTMSFSGTESVPERNILPATSLSSEQKPPPNPTPPLRSITKKLPKTLSEMLREKLDNLEKVPED